MNAAAFRPRRIGRSVALALLAVALLSAFSSSTRIRPEAGGETGARSEGEPASRGGRDPSGEWILPHPLAFRALVHLTDSGRQIRYGEYASRRPRRPSMRAETDPRDVINYEVTVPPGANIYDVAKLLEEGTLVTAEVFLATAASPAVLRRLGIPGRARRGIFSPTDTSS